MNMVTLPKKTTVRRGRRVLHISTTLFCQLFTAGRHDGYTVVNDPVPDDASIIDIRWNGFDDVIAVLLESAAWSETDPAMMHETITPELTL